MQQVTPVGFPYLVSKLHFHLMALSYSIKIPTEAQLSAMDVSSIYYGPRHRASLTTSQLTAHTPYIRRVVERHRSLAKHWLSCDMSFQDSLEAQPSSSDSFAEKDIPEELRDAFSQFDQSSDLILYLLDYYEGQGYIDSLLRLESYLEICMFLSAVAWTEC